MYASLLWGNRHILRDPEAMDREAANSFPTVGHLKFLVEAYKPDKYWFEALECVRRLLLASVVGIVSPGTPANAVVGLLICLVFLFVFIKLAPFVDSNDNSTGVILAYSLTLLFLAALMVKVNATSQDESDQRVYGICLILVLVWGPASIICQWFMSFCRRFCVKQTPHQEAPPRQFQDPIRKPTVPFYQSQSEDLSDFTIEPEQAEYIPPPRATLTQDNDKTVAKLSRRVEFFSLDPKIREPLSSFEGKDTPPNSKAVEKDLDDSDLYYM